MTNIEKALVELDYCTDKYITANNVSDKNKYRNLCEYWQAILIEKFKLTIGQINQMTYGENGVLIRGLRKND